MSVGYVGGELVSSCDFTGFPSGCFAGGEAKSGDRHSSTAGYGGWGSPSSVFENQILQTPIALFLEDCRPSMRYWSR
jgi:hypothetical protein